MADFGVDFSPIGRLGEVYRQAQQRATRERVLGQLSQGSGPLDYSAAARALLPVDPEGGLSLARLAEAAAERQRQQANTDRAFGLQERQFTAGIEGQRMSPGFEKDPATGGIRPIKGGPQDPDYIERLTAAKDKGREFSANDLTKLTEEGGKFSNLSNFATTFQDRFAGYKVPGIGNAAMSAGRFIPGAVGMVPGLNEADVREGAQWWQGYDRYKNQVRNELFGSALTANEQAAFERADIGPGMDPSQIKSNLNAQQKILKDAMKRKAGALIAGGFKAEPIARAYGLKLDELGVDTTKKGAAPAAAPAMPKVDKARVDAARADPAAALSDAKAAIDGGKAREPIIQFLRAAGIDPSGL